MDKPFVPSFNYHMRGFPNLLQFPFKESLCFFKGEHWYYSGVDQAGAHHMRCLIFTEESGCIYHPKLSEPYGFYVLTGQELGTKLHAVNKFKRDKAIL